MPGKNLLKNIPSKPEYAEAVLPAGGSVPGDIRISSTALTAVIRRAACSVGGVTRIAGNSLVDNIAEFVGSKKVMDRAIQIKINGLSVEIELAVNICYGFALPEIAGSVQKTVAREVQDFTGLNVSSVNVIIREMEFPSDDRNEDE